MVVGTLRAGVHVAIRVDPDQCERRPVVADRQLPDGEPSPVGVELDPIRPHAGAGRVLTTMPDAPILVGHEQLDDAVGTTARRDGVSSQVAGLAQRLPGRTRPAPRAGLDSVHDGSAAGGHAEQRDAPVGVRGSGDLDQSDLALVSNSAQSDRSGEPGATCVLWNRGPTGPSGTPRSNMLVANTSSRPSALRAAAIDVNWPGSCAQADQLLLPAGVCERWNGAPVRLTPNSSTRPSALVSTQTHRSAPSRMDQATDPFLSRPVQILSWPSVPTNRTGRPGPRVAAMGEPKMIGLGRAKWVGSSSWVLRSTGSPGRSFTRLPRCWRSFAASSRASEASTAGWWMSPCRKSSGASRSTIVVKMEMMPPPAVMSNSRLWIGQSASDDVVTSQKPPPPKPNQVRGCGTIWFRWLWPFTNRTTLGKRSNSRSSSCSPRKSGPADPRLLRG